MTDNDNEKALNDAVAQGNWEKAIDYAKQLPVNWDPWQQFPTKTEAGMPDHAVNQALDHLANPMNPHSKNLLAFLFELSSNLHHPSITPKTLQRIADLDDAKNDYHVSGNILKHPKFKYTPEQQALKNVADFWTSYERKVKPNHFAAVKSHATGKPEDILDHRGTTGNSHEAVIHGTTMFDPSEDVIPAAFRKDPGLSTKDIIPHLGKYAEKTQQAIMNDPDIQKRYIGGKPHVKLFRGLNGEYGKIIRQNVNYDPSTHAVDKKSLSLPTAPMSSWTLDHGIASRFAWDRADIPGQEKSAGVVLSKWIPLSNVMHSGKHDVVMGQEHAHPDESELVVKHPTGKMSVSTNEMYFQPKPADSNVMPANYGDVHRGQVRKSDNDIPYHRNKEKSPDMGTRFGQHIEPTGEYMSHHEPGSLSDLPNYEYGKVHFKKPLVIPWESEKFPMNHSKGSWGWKSELHSKYGKTGKDLSDHLRSLGYDGIITTGAFGPGSIGEMVNLNGHKELSKSENLEKGFKEKLASLATAAAIVGAPYNQAKAPVDVPQIPKVSVTQEQGLRPIAYIESRNGANMRHEKVHHGLNSGTSAIGIYGFMPLQVQDTIKHDDILKQKYGKLLQYHPVKQSSAIEHFLLDHPDAQHELANSHWHRVNSIFHKNKDRAVYAWKYGIHGAAHAPAETIQNDPYVKDYHKYKKMLDVEKPYKSNEPLRQIKKSEENVKLSVSPMDWGAKNKPEPGERHDPKKHDFFVFAHNHKGEEIGYAAYSHAPSVDAKGFHSTGMEVDPHYRRQGIGTSMHVLAEQVSGKKLQPAKNQTEEGSKLWSQHNRPFGKSEDLGKAIDPKKGEKDISKKSLNEIQKDTAEVWASRAIAAYKKFEETKDPQWKIDAEEYRHEAVEHAALVVDVYPNLIKEVSDAMEKYRGKTTEEMESVCKVEYPAWLDNSDLVDYLAVVGADVNVGDKAAYRKTFRIGNLTLRDKPTDLKKAEQYSSLSPEARPPIVVDEEGVVLDGSHRYRAALVRGESTVDAYVAVSPEVLEKGVKQRLFPFNPASVSEEHRQKVGNWVDPRDTGITYGRQSMPRLAGNARSRALHSLSGKTNVRWNGQSNEREFLLHRGVSDYEHQQTVSNGRVNNEDKRSSWTPSHDTATTFGENYNPKEGQKPLVVSAWVPESKIHHVPLQLGSLGGSLDNPQDYKGPSERKNEYEIIVDPGTFDVDHANKSEFLDLESLFKTEFNPAAGVTDFVPLYVSDENQGESSYIDQMIKNGKTYNLLNKGLFTNESFITGSSPQHAWLIKVEPDNRPGIKAVQGTGLQSVKEAAFYEAAKVFGLSEFVPQTILGHIHKDGQEKWAVAIKMLPPQFKPMAKENDENHGASKGIMRKYIVTGLAHMLSSMLYVLGDLDSHGNNWMTDGTHIVAIDHGSSFADMRSEDKSDKKMHVPYVLRTEGFKKKMSPDQKLSFMPKVPTANALDRLKRQILSVNPQRLEQVIASYKLDPRPEVARLKILQHLVKFSEHPDIILNHLWISGAPQELIEKYHGEKDGP